MGSQAVIFLAATGRVHKSSLAHTMNSPLQIHHGSLNIGQKAAIRTSVKTTYFAMMNHSDHSRAIQGPDPWPSVTSHIRYLSGTLSDGFGLYAVPFVPGQTFLSQLARQSLFSSLCEQPAGNRFYP